MAPLTWLVTGCSSGFGEIFVHSLIARGERVIATGRKASERLAHLQNTGAKILDIDITSPQEVLDAKVKEAIGLYNGIDVLVNNAGYVEAGLSEHVSHESWTAQLNTSLLGHINMTRALLPHFREKRAGKVAFIGSYGGWTGEVGAGPYCTAKFGMEGYVECLQKEVAQFGIEVTIFEPGYFRTKIFSAQNCKVSLPTHADYEPLFNAMAAGVAAIDGKQRGDSVKCVERIIDVMKSEGMAAGRTIPKRLPLGPDAKEYFKNKCLETLKLLEEWDDVICSTDLDPEKVEENKAEGQYAVTAETKA